MVKNKKVLIVANWKMYVSNTSLGSKIIKKAISVKAKGAELIFCVPSTMISPLSKDFKATKVSFGSQNISSFDAGAHTGELNGEMVRGSGAKYSIVGHSERRKMGESNEVVGEKVLKALLSKLTPIVCIGEAVHDDTGAYLDFLKEQIKTAYSLIDISRINETILAYEPIWAIGKSESEAMNPHLIQEIVLYSARVIRELGGKATQPKAIIYGGAVAPENSKSILVEGGVDGFLVGHESAIPENFAKIIENVSAK